VCIQRPASIAARVAASCYQYPSITL
jgi:hypothetical protein